MKRCLCDWCQHERYQSETPPLDSFIVVGLDEVIHQGVGCLRGFKTACGTTATKSRINSLIRQPTKADRYRVLPPVSCLACIVVT